MFESPRSLQEVCIDFICGNVLGLCEVHLGDTNVHSPGATVSDRPDICTVNNNSTEEFAFDTTTGRTSSNDAPTSSATRLTFRHPDAFLPAEVSEQLLSNLCEKKTLSDLTITLFDSKTTRLRHVRLKDASTLSAKGLRVLKQHKVVDLIVNGLKITVNDLISCLGDWSLQNLRSLSVAKGSFMDCSRHCVVVTLSKLRALHTLNVSGTEFNKHGLDIVVEDLPLLESLDISCTRVDDITPLRKCKDRLKTLNMYNLKISGCGNLIPVLLELNELRHLDISDEKDAHAFEVFAPARPKITDFLRALHCMPHLTTLDLSGKDDINPKDLKNFIASHVHLRFLGLVHSDACYDESFIDLTHEDYRPELVISGTATESQILEALRRYTYRPIYLQKCLFNLFRLTPNFLEPRVDVIKLVLPGMREHPQEFRVQMAATACIYNLTKGELALMIHPSILKQIVELTLLAMESYPNNHQLQKNTLLTLCSDRILQDVAFDKYRCARLVMNCLSTFDDASMNRMSVAICSILAAKISTVETSMLGAQPQYMLKLLAMVRSKVESRIVDITMKFTLSALWNLTDESAVTCKVFLDEGGMELFLEVLDSFQGESSVETKVLGLLNNIAEVDHLRPRLMQPRFIKMLSMLLDSEHIDVSYFAAGIAAHLLSDGPRSWYSMPSQPSREQLLDQLVHAVTHWQTPQGEMVAYRSFQPFFPLLRCADAYPVQLWAVWAIHHVCTKNPKRYCVMLVREGGVETLKQLEKTHTECTTQPNLQSLCQSILETLELNS
ncbi:PREDICTED: protein zyg-11 homolog B-like isoform X1 [Dinoponera quadriceps]|uniref:Protein zyg-11 homolog B-like isoform X1 n=1 Tax=Dinoponera quadriceps TaxID=609295 RepID=A0A6P3Y3S9_DINQU|nr:PREDICTED: protein zyg-11 homolog B-like isoform X1 [Dinoponera quadriceps]XP_014485535.1 PREDICTED: protein zyg-11 homolog B-like isoform X1 [Dinoponera quadriceps]XP_014485536.1 PREDICTED: protein zyg-11 homolog B-like isoform X1 [Dinoponera quadriceps]XP_014485537.1 PREDICTED: protein zyg-11 homolog B-like isoform X1 [Dinoponera quadriceps]XP_014485538.1 PREDICTED: protein zyg-11 homolog B-like isoform X1 [Dinoponera quadriceps]XP_014485539.1 PREDICTED: protein zyg-11 homolog B-like isof